MWDFNSEFMSWEFYKSKMKIFAFFLSIGIRKI